MKKIQFLTMAVFGLLMSVSGFAADGEFVEGTDYEVMSPKNQTQPIVEEFFNYACGACFSAEQFSTQFKEKHPNVKFDYIPVELRPSWKIYVEAYYIGKKLGMLEVSHPKLFNRIHVEKKYLKDHDEMKEFFLALGADEKKYDKTVKSTWLKIQLRQAKQYAFKNRVTGTPVYLVNKRFKLNRTGLGSFDRIEKAIISLSGAKAEAAPAK